MPSPAQGTESVNRDRRYELQLTAHSGCVAKIPYGWNPSVTMDAIILQVPRIAV